MASPRSGIRARPGGAAGGAPAGRSEGVELYTLGGVRLVRGDVDLTEMLGAKHLALLSSEHLIPGRIVHAYSGHAVCETSLTDSWLRRIAAVFRFPEREK